MARSALFAACLSLCPWFFVPMAANAQLRMESIKAAHEYSASGPGLGMIVYEGGRIRFEDYYNSHSVSKPLHIYSGTKSFFGVVAAIGLDHGWLDLDERVSETILEWRDDPRKSRITVRDLLNFTSGLETGFSEIYGRSSADKLTLAIGLDAEAGRGETFVYGPGHLQVFGEVLRRKLRRRMTTYDKFLERQILRPLDITVTQWRDDAHGNPILSAGMYMTGRDWLTFGQMVIRGGEWNGKRIVSIDSLRRCFTGTRINPAYGLTFWVNGYATRADARVVDVEEWLDRDPLPIDWSRACLSRDAPPDMVTALGSNFQRLYMVPSMQLVVVHLGRKGTFRDEEFLRILFRDATLPQLTQSDVPPVEVFRPDVQSGGGLFKKLFKDREGE